MKSDETGKFENTKHDTSDDTISLKGALTAFEVAIPEDVATAYIVLTLDSVFEYFDRKNVKFFSSTLDNYLINSNGSAYINLNFDELEEINCLADFSSVFPFINHLGTILYDALDYGIKAGDERELSEKLEDLLTFLSSSDSDPEIVDLVDPDRIETIYQYIMNLCMNHLKLFISQINDIKLESAKIIAKYYSKSHDVIRIKKIISLKNTKIASKGESVPQPKIDISDIELKIKERRSEQQKRKLPVNLGNQNTNKIDNSERNKKEGDNDKTKKNLEGDKLAESIDSMFAVQNSKQGKNGRVDEKTLQKFKVKRRRKRRRRLPSEKLNSIEEEDNDEGEDDESSLEEESGELSEVLIDSNKEDSTVNSQKLKESNLKPLKIIELSSIQTKCILADLDLKNASREYIRILNDGLFCAVCHVNKAQEDDKCCVCGFGVCRKHIKYVYFPLKFNVRDNFIHLMEISKKDIPALGLMNYIDSPICIVCLELAIAIKDEYIASIKQSNT